MPEAEARRVQHHARRGPGVAAVSPVPEDRHPRLGQVNADLVLAAGAGTRFDEKAAREGLHDREVGHSRT